MNLVSLHLARLAAISVLETGYRTSKTFCAVQWPNLCSSRGLPTETADIHVNVYIQYGDQDITGVRRVPQPFLAWLKSPYNAGVLF